MAQNDQYFTAYFLQKTTQLKKYADNYQPNMKTLGSYFEAVLIKAFNEHGATAKTYSQSQINAIAAFDDPKLSATQGALTAKAKIDAAMNAKAQAIKKWVQEELPQGYSTNQAHANLGGQKTAAKGDIEIGPVMIEAKVKQDNIKWLNWSNITEENMFNARPFTQFLNENHKAYWNHLYLKQAWQARLGIALNTWLQTRFPGHSEFIDFVRHKGFAAQDVQSKIVVTAEVGHKKGDPVKIHMETDEALFKRIEQNISGSRRGLTKIDYKMYPNEAGVTFMDNKNQDVMAFTISKFMNKAAFKSQYSSSGNQGKKDLAKQLYVTKDNAEFTFSTYLASRLVFQSEIL